VKANSDEFLKQNTSAGDLLGKKKKED